LCRRSAVAVADSLVLRAAQAAAAVLVIALVLVALAPLGRAITAVQVSDR
jgi:hypothetical protein